MTMKLAFTSENIDRIETELLVFMHYQDDVPLTNLLGLVDWRVNGRLSRFIQADGFNGKPRELLLLPAEHRLRAEQVMIMGLGPREYFHQDHVNQVLDFFLQQVENKRTERVCFSLSQLLQSQFEWRNAVRLLLTKLVDCRHIKEVILREPIDLVRDAKRRQINFGPQVRIEYQ